MIDKNRIVENLQKNIALSNFENELNARQDTKEYTHKKFWRRYHIKKVLLSITCCSTMLIGGIAYAYKNYTNHFKLGNNFLIVEDSHYLDPTIENHRETGREDQLTFINGFLLMGKFKHNFGKTKTYKYENNGIDIYAPIGSKVLALADGIVKEANFDSNYGNYIIIKNNEDYETLYTHLDEITINEGDNISQGEEIGTSGITGNTIAPHLHIELHYRGSPVDPLDYIDKNNE